jgi:dipeptidyl aminopeptidase/acylaminoacyl peptidase
MLPPGVSTHLRLHEEALGNGRILTCGLSSTISPALIVIHGGKASSQAAVEYCKSFHDKLADMGFLVFSIDYPENMTLIDEINYILQAIKHIKKKNFINHEKICIIGTSRGGYLALMTSIETNLKCIIDAYGPTDLEETFNHARRDPALWSEWGGYYTSIIKYVEENKLNKTLVLQALSPIHNVAKINGKILLMHGLRDETIPPTHSIMLAEALKEEGKTNYVIKLYEEERHGFSLLKGKPYEDLRKFLQEFLEES